MTRDATPLFTPEDLAEAASAAAEMQREFEEFAAQLQTPEAKEEYAALARDASEMWEGFRRDCAAGRYALTPAELEQLRRDGILTKSNVSYV